MYLINWEEEAAPALVSGAARVAFRSLFCYRFMTLALFTAVVYRLNG